MIRHLFTVSAAVQASPPAVHAILADYRSERPRLLTPGAVGYRVVEGGPGAGTVYGFDMPAAGFRETRVVVEEPDPGQVLVERDLAGGEIRTYTMAGAGYNGGTLLTLEVSWDGSDVGAWIQRTFRASPRRRAYAQALSELAGFIEARTAERAAV